MIQVSMDGVFCTTAPPSCIIRELVKIMGATPPSCNIPELVKKILVCAVVTSTKPGDRHPVTCEKLFLRHAARGACFALAPVPTYPNLIAPQPSDGDGHAIAIPGRRVPANFANGASCHFIHVTGGLQKRYLTALRVRQYSTYGSTRPGKGKPRP